MKQSLLLVAALAFGASLASAGTVTFTCDPSISAGTCNYLNTNVAANYSSAFSNANANVYIQFGTTDLAQSTQGFDNQVSYAQYAGALAAEAAASGNPIQISAVAALLANDASVYGSGNVDITSALANALGISGDVVGGNAGITGPGGTICFTPGTAGCYNGVITMSNAANTFYYDDLGGTEPSTEYDFYGTVEHETDELLGTASCISTTTTPLSNGCPGASPSTVDLFRYAAAGSLVLDSSLSTTPGAYFSYDGGATNGANGFIYNTLDNGEDYADFLSNCPAGPFSIQDAEGCPGTDAGQSILNDGGAEVNILNAVGYTLNNSSVPEPGTIALLGAGLAALGLCRRLRRA